MFHYWIYEFILEHSFSFSVQYELLIVWLCVSSRTDRQMKMQDWPCVCSVVFNGLGILCLKLLYSVHKMTLLPDRYHWNILYSPEKSHLPLWQKKKKKKNNIWANLSPRMIPKKILEAPLCLSIILHVLGTLTCLWTVMFWREFVQFKGS